MRSGLDFITSFCDTLDIRHLLTNAKGEYDIIFWNNRVAGWLTLILT